MQHRPALLIRAPGKGEKMFIECSGYIPEKNILYPGDDPVYINSDFVTEFYIASGRVLRSDTSGFFAAARCSNGVYRVTKIREIPKEEAAFLQENPREGAKNDLRNLMAAIADKTNVYTDVNDRQHFVHIFVQNLQNREGAKRKAVELEKRQGT